MSSSGRYASRAGEKLEFALEAFAVDPAGLVAADLGSNVGGFVDCLLVRGARRVFSVDTSYGTLAWKLRQDPRVVVLERTNALHLELPGPVDLVTVDVGWTPQARVLPVARRLLASGGRILSLVKPQYEARKDELEKGFVRPEAIEAVLARTRAAVEALAWPNIQWVECPLGGGKRNREFFVLLAGGVPGDGGV